jgi:hypothetical protein
LTQRRPLGGVEIGLQRGSEGVGSRKLKLLNVPALLKQIVRLSLVGPV